MTSSGLSDPALSDGPTWRRSFDLLNRHPRSLLLPLAVTQLPATVLSALAYFVLLWRIFPEVDYQGLPQLDEQPRNYLLSVFIINGAYWMFTLVGIAGTIVAAQGAADGDTVHLSAALDPGFTRLGGLLALGAVFFALVVGTLVGLVVLVYVIWRFGLALQQYVLGGSGTYGALGRSWLLLRGRMLRFAGMLATLVPLSLGVLAVGFVAAGLVVLPLAFFEQSRAVDLAGASLGASIAGVFAILVSAYVAVATTLFYLDVKAELDV